MTTDDMGQAAQQLRFAGDGPLDVPVLQFVRSERQCFNVEFTQDGDDLVFHFFLPTHLEKYAGSAPQLEKYWTSRFPEALDDVARRHFQAEFPQLKAQRVEELGIDSWWMRAYALADREDLEDFIEKFYLAFEEKLNSKSM